MTSKRKTKQLRWLVTMILLVTAMAMPKMAWAEITPQQPSGGGTSENPYQISTAAQLYWFAGLVNGTLTDGTSQKTNANAVLTKDITVNIDLLASLNKDGSIKEDGKTVDTWKPIGSNGVTYEGIFDGQGHTISGLYFNNSNTNYVGLFGYNQGTIKNVGVVDSYFCGNQNVGGVCGYNFLSGTITGCNNTGTVSGNTGVGGVCGYNNGGKITGCYNTGTVRGSGDDVGGVCGANYEGGKITGCYNTGTVSGNEGVGGVCGANYTGGKITGCYNTGTVSGSDSYVGGVCGQNSSGTITYCYYLSGKATGGISSNNVAGSAEAKTEEQFKSGDVYSLLNTALQEAKASVLFYKGANYPELIMNVPSLDKGVYQITNKEELYAFALLVNKKVDASANAVLTADITVNTSLLASLNEDGSIKEDGKTVETWTPIGNLTLKYAGTFDGQGHTISGLYKDSNTGYVGLFGYNQGTIKNVGVVDSYFKGFNDVGGVCGYNDGGTITDCYNKGSVSGHNGVGGVCGGNVNKGTITGCYNTGKVSGYQYVGGVCGHNSSGTITGCYNTGKVSDSGTGTYVGGVCGGNSNGTITGCHNTGTVSGEDISYVGGVCGDNNGGTITGCYNEGEVSAGGTGTYVGGVCGDNDGGTITGCYNTGKVSGTGRARVSGSYVGGVCGANSGTITGCYNTGEVSGESTVDDSYPSDSYVGGSYVGGVCGANSGIITDCYNTGNVSGTGTVKGELVGGSYVEGSYVGGVCGYNVNGGKITGCYNKGTVKGTGTVIGTGKVSGSYVGGVCGFNGGTITGCYNTGTVSGSSSVGGVCGHNSSGTITGCYNTGKVSGNSYVGGVCGQNSSGTITYCYYLSGKANGGIDSNDVTDSAEAKTEELFKNGEVCTPLNTALKKANASVRFYKGANYPEIFNLPSLDKDVYQISNKEELYAFALVVNNVDASAKAVLTADITVNTDLLASLKEDGSIIDGKTVDTWKPIGSFDNPYKGTFDGQGHTISGLYFNNSNTNYVGLFGRNQGTIKNVGVVDSYFYGYNYVGGVCGYNDGGTITDCYNKGTVSGSRSVGGVCGYNNGGTITGCYNTGTVSGNNEVGGVCGYNILSGTITGCYNKGEVNGSGSGSGNNVGGVCGYNNKCTITGCYNTGSVSGSGIYVGGVCGFNTNGGTITGCYNTGSVSGSNNSVGGVCGDNNGGTITDCYNTGSVSGSSNVGGVCGYNFGGTITGCYNTESVSGSSNVGGVCGNNANRGTITGCYYDNVKCTIKGINGSDVPGQAEGKSTTQFQSGEVCYLLSQGSTVSDGENTTYYSGSVWSQQLGTDNYPVFGDYKVIKAAKGNNNTYWATFSNQSSDMDLSDLTVYTAKVSEGILKLTPCTDNIVAKGEGVLVKGNSEYLNAKARNEKIASPEANNDLVATPAEPTVINATTDHVLYRLTYNNVSTKTGLGFYLSLVKDENGNVDNTSLGKKLKATPGKAYLKVYTPGSEGAPIRGFVIGEDDNTTGIDVITINGIDTNDSKFDDSVYDLMGRKVSKPAKGIYIKNGKKVIIK